MGDCLVYSRSPEEASVTRPGQRGRAGDRLGQSCSFDEEARVFLGAQGPLKCVKLWRLSGGIKN